MRKTPDAESRTPASRDGREAIAIAFVVAIRTANARKGACHNAQSLQKTTHP